MLNIQTGCEALRAPDNYGASQTFARDARAEDANGLLYPSVRNPGGLCFAAFFLDVMGRPKQARHFSYHWNGVRVDQIKDLASGDVYAIEDV